MRTILVLAALLAFSITLLEAGHRHRHGHHGSRFKQFSTHFSFGFGGGHGSGHYERGPRYYCDDPYGKHHYKRRRKYCRRHRHYHYDGRCPHRRYYRGGYDDY